MSYSANKIFKDSKINALLDNLYYQIIKGSSVQDLSSIFVLSGKAAAILQGAADEPLKNIVFQTNDAKILQFAQFEIKNIINSITGVIAFKDRVLLYYKECYIEIWYNAAAIATVVVNNVELQDINEINPVLL